MFAIDLEDRNTSASIWLYILTINHWKFIVHLLSALREHQSIKHLSLRVCDVNPSDLKENCLRNSLLKDKIISHQFKQAIVHASQENRSLTHLDLYENQINADDISQLYNFCTNNEILIHLIISTALREHSIQKGR